MFSIFDHERHDDRYLPYAATRQEKNPSAMTPNRAAAAGSVTEGRPLLVRLEASARDTIYS